MCIRDSYKSGHALNNKLARALMADSTAWEWASYPARETTQPVVTYAGPVYA